MGHMSMWLYWGLYFSQDTCALELCVCVHSVFQPAHGAGMFHRWNFHKSAQISHTLRKMFNSMGSSLKVCFHKWRPSARCCCYILYPIVQWHRWFANSDVPFQSVTNDLLHGQFAMQTYALHQVDVTSELLHLWWFAHAQSNGKTMYGSAYNIGFVRTSFRLSWQKKNTWPNNYYMYYRLEIFHIKGFCVLMLGSRQCKHYIMMMSPCHMTLWWCHMTLWWCHMTLIWCHWSPAGVVTVVLLLTRPGSVQNSRTSPPTSYVVAVEEADILHLIVKWTCEQAVCMCLFVYVCVCVCVCMCVCACMCVLVIFYSLLFLNAVQQLQPWR